MKNLEVDLDEALNDFTREGLKRLVKKLVMASEEQERDMLRRATDKQPNKLADLDEEMHGKPNTPKVEDDDLPKKGEELPEVPRKKGRA